MTVIIVFTLFLAGFAFVGISSSKKKQTNTQDYLLAGKDVKPWLVALSAVATNNSGYMFIGMIGYTYTVGLSSIWIMIGWILGDFIASLFIYKNVRQISGDNNILSFGSLMAHRKSGLLPIVRFLAGLLSMVFLCTYAAAQFYAGGKALLVTLDWPETVGIFLGAILVVAYCFSGGIRASIWTDAAQSIVMIIAMSSLMYVAVDHLGGFGSAINSLNEVSESYMGLMPEFNNTLMGWAPLLFVVGWLFAGFGVVGQPHIMVRYMTLNSPKKMNEVRAYYYTWFTAFYAMAIMVGLVSRVIIPSADGFDPELALPTLSMQLLPDFMVGVMLAGIFAATISTADSLVISCTAAVTNDLFPQLKNRYNLSKAVTLGVTVLAIGIAMAALVAGESVFKIVIYSWAILGSAFGPLLSVLMLKKAPNQTVSILMIVTGALVALSWNLTGMNEYTYEMFPGMLSGILIYFISLFFVKPEEIKKQ